MLTIQPKILNNYRPSFKCNEEYCDHEIYDLSEMDEDSYESTKADLREQKANFEELAEDKEFNLPKPIKKIIKGGAILTTGLLGGMATGWGTKKSLQGLSKLKKTAPMKSIGKYLKAGKKFIANLAKTTKAKFIDSDLYKMPAKGLKKLDQKIMKSKIGAPILKFFKSIGKGIKKAYNTVKKGIKFVYNKIKGVKKQTWEKATVNTVGVSGGIASGVTALKEKSEAGE